jgi:hypothetical protein
MWTVLRPGDRQRYVTCRCDCGTVRDVFSGNLAAGSSTSCGCRWFARGPATAAYRHGLSHTAEWNTYHSMLRRCYNPASRDFPKYGGRGISVCDEWRASIVAFVTDMGRRPDGMTLERIDNDGDYGPENCRWASKADQARNTRRNVIVSYEGRSQTLTEWARELGINHQTLSARYIRGDRGDRLLRAPNR